MKEAIGSRGGISLFSLSLTLCTCIGVPEVTEFDVRLKLIFFLVL